MRFIFSSLIKAIGAGALLASAAPAAAQYFDIYGDANRTLPAAQSAYDAMDEDASKEARAKLTSDLIMGLIGKAKYKEAYELYLESAELNLHPDARMAAIGHGLVAFTKDEALITQYIAALEQMVESPSCAPCYARTFAAHHLGRYYFMQNKDLPRSIEWHKKALDIALVDLAADDPARVNFAYQYAAYLRNQDLPASAKAVQYTEALAIDLLPRDDHLGWLYVFLANALVALDSGRTAEAADLFGRIADIGVKEWGPTDPQLLGIFQNTAILNSRLGRTEQAVNVALRAEDNQAYSDKAEHAYHQALIARLLFEDARPQEADQYFAQAMALYADTSDDDTFHAQARMSYANTLSILGRHEEALELMGKALPIFEQLEATVPQAREYRTLAAIIYARAGAMQTASATLAPVLEVNETALLDIYAKDQDRRAVASDGTEIFRDATLISLLNGDEDRAWRSAQLAVISDLAMSAAALTYPGDPEGFAAALDDVRLARTAQDEARVALANGEGSASALARASAQREAGETQLNTRYPDFAEYLRPQPLSINDARALLSEGEAYILPMVYSDRVVTMVITADGFAWGQSQTTTFEARELIANLRASLDASLGGEDQFDAEAAHRLYALIFTDEVFDAVRDKDKLIFPAGGPLAVIPPSVLVSDMQEGEAAEFLVERHAIAITPGLGGRALARQTAPKSFAGIGAPSLAAPPANRFALRGTVVDVKSISALPSLPGADEELTALKSAFDAAGTLVLTGDAATEEAVRQAPLADYQILAFATHGLVSGQIAGLSEPALVLTPDAASTSAQNDGLLTASEIGRLRLAADWVVLSACNTAAGEGVASPTYSGLARAFQLAGARSLLLSHWPVRDDVAARLSVATVKASGNGMERSEALRQAQLSVMNDGSTKDARSPVLWAPFVIIE
ncbi:CHAT domain-containing protein [Erythrobacter sp. SCSIO 43205]|uniref:CHAT domain-containing protein n=1 Tax=Erythrobacter sp. SCSIO 43205 TaxID=2779361 RepID=UPI001CA92849|nr:CHAT domain-containing tetratricopeptide repeat protein [Erythrobacter sp. SCSIO 43205]UAB78391.1 CHAT domain-containing protein [Erythrobacter sp. SCSIO 43205]